MMPYILQSGIILAGCLSFYKILLQKETFYQLNRFVLLICLVLSFALPFIPIPQQLSFKTAVVTQNKVLSKPVSYSDIGTDAPIQRTASGSNVEADNSPLSINFAQLRTFLFDLYWFGVVAFSFNFLVQFISLMFKVYINPVIRDGRFRIVEFSGDKAPCSFGNIIFINPEKYDWDTYDQILQHEKIHIRQRHSLDILIAEIVLIFQWFNPFAWLYRKEFENNLEFLTDDQLLQQGKVDRTSYQMNLLKVSAPHFPLGLTTNYNQSLLKKRVVMMNAKKSNINTTWKYLFLFPLLVTFMSLLNEPVALAQTPVAKNNKQKEHNRQNHKGLATEGAWFATIKNDKLSIQFKNDDDENSFSNSTFPINKFTDLPKGKQGTFSLQRDAGTMEFTGKFEGNRGMGTYKFVADKGFDDYLHKENIEIDNQDIMTFFMVDVTKSYIEMLKAQGYSDLSKNDLIPLAALKVDASYIQSLKQEGLQNLSLQQLIPLKSLDINSDYVKDIRNAGYKKVSSEQLITFKSQGIDGKYIAEVRNAAKKQNGTGPDGKASPKGNKTAVDEDDAEPSANDLIAIKSLNIDPKYISSLKEAGYDHLSNSDLIAMKSQGITADYIKNFSALGYKNISSSDLIAFKSQDISKDYIKSFEGLGYGHIPGPDLISLKALGVSANYIKSIKDLGFKDISPEDAVALKSQGITENLINEYKKLGFSNMSISDVISATATETTPTFITSMKAKGFNFKNIEKYIQLKTTVEE